MMAYLDGYSGYSGVPEDAAAEILEKLMTHQQISSDEVAQILKRYGVWRRTGSITGCVPKKIGQRLIASLRDPYGRREVFFHGQYLTFWWIAAMTVTRWNTSTRSWLRTWKQSIRRHVRLTIVCRCCSGFRGTGGSADEII